MTCKILKEILRASFRKIFLFLLIVLLLTVLSGILMYFVEGVAGGFITILSSIFWASTTLLSLGFGDIVPQTGLGRFIAFILQLLGYSILIVPIFIVIAETFIYLCDSLSRKDEDFK